MIPEERWGLDLDEDTLTLRAHYENDLAAFAQYVNPQYMYGDEHRKVFKWLSQTESDDPEVAAAATYQLLMLPRGHLKSHCMAVWVVWKTTKNPWTTTIYLTAGEDLATVQMNAMKTMFTCEEYLTLWPEMFSEKKADRDKWATWAINTDHPVRKERRIRDWTVIIKTIGSSATGLHCDNLVLDDVVTQNNAYTQTGRDAVAATVADFAAVKNTGAITKVAGTRYDDKDLYGKMIDAEVPLVDEETGEQTGTYKQWQVIVREVEDKGNGLGKYIWPRTKSPVTGLWYGFNFKELVAKKVEFLTFGTERQFNSQYYNNPDLAQQSETTGFQYYNRSGLSRSGDTWYYGDKKLEVVAGGDLAWTDETGKKNQRSDYTAFIVIGIDCDGFIYLLDAVQFRTAKYSEYYRHIAKLYDLWRFRKMFIESESAGKFIVAEMQSMVREDTLGLVIVGKTVSRTMSKEERAAMVLEPRYEGQTVLHYKGGIVSILEDQLKVLKPKFDDLRDALVIAIQNIKKPSGRGRANRAPVAQTAQPQIMGASRFGGRRRG
jgi:hypothetical protein